VFQVVCEGYLRCSERGSDRTREGGEVGLMRRIRSSGRAKNWPECQRKSLLLGAGNERGENAPGPEPLLRARGIRSLRTIPGFVERETCGVKRAGGCPSIPGGLRRIFEM
jgi:hypothetical protein